MNKKSTITLNIILDKDNIPKKITWKASDTNQEVAKTNSFLLSLWDDKNKSTLKIDLWTKDMLADDMKKLIHQTMMSFSDTLRRATGDDEASDNLEKFLVKFAKKLKVSI